MFERKNKYVGTQTNIFLVSLEEKLDVMKVWSLGLIGSERSNLEKQIEEV